MIFLYLEEDGRITHNGRVCAYQVPGDPLHTTLDEALTNVRLLYGEYGEYEVIDCRTQGTLAEGFIRRDGSA